MMEYRCPYCGEYLSDEDMAEDGEALWCSDCAMRVEFWDAIENAEDEHEE